MYDNRFAVSAERNVIKKAEKIVKYKDLTI
jgi:hypothetical protein